MKLREANNFLNSKGTRNKKRWIIIGVLLTISIIISIILTLLIIFVI